MVLFSSIFPVPWCLLSNTDIAEQNHLTTLIHSSSQKISIEHLLWGNPDPDGEDSPVARIEKVLSLLEFT